MTLEILDIVSLPGGAHNEDRAGYAGPMAWVIDGATDVVPEPLVGATTDADWFAGAVDEALRRVAAHASPALADIPAHVAAEIAPMFLAASRRKPSSREEHPSAAGLIVRESDDGALEYLSLGDCTLLMPSAGGIRRIGTREEEAGDPWVAEAIVRQRTVTGRQSGAEERALLWPKLRAARGFMNVETGYAIFSITAPPAGLVSWGVAPVPRRAPVLLATDGLMRLTDVFCRYDAASLLENAERRGLSALVSELRDIESADPDGLRFPRAKTSDDATAILLRVL